jgi:hypothetical protein
MAYGPHMSPMGSGPSYGPMSDVLFPRTLAPNTQHISTDRFQDGGMNDGVREQIAQTLREFGFNPKGRARAYQKPYLEYFDTIPGVLGFPVSLSSPMMTPGQPMNTWASFMSGLTTSGLRMYAGCVCSRCLYLELCLVGSHP